MNVMKINLEADREVSVEVPQGAVNIDDVLSSEDMDHCSQKQKQEQETAQSQSADKDLHKNTLVVNFYAGPGAGKTTAALELTAALKKAGYDVEYVSEYAKELVREGKLDVLDDQKAVIEEQYKRLHNMAVSGVQIIVTDSPLLLGQVYGQGKIDEAYHKQIRQYYDSFDNFNLRVVRAEGATYQQEGRVENEAQAKDLDERIRTMLKENKVFYGNYQRDEIEKTVERINQTYNRLYGEHKEKKEEDTKALLKENAKQYKKVGQEESTFDRAEHIDAAVAGYMLENTNKSLRESMYDVVQMSDKDVKQYANIYRKAQIGEVKPTPKEVEYAVAGYSLENPNLSYRYCLDDVDEMSDEVVKKYANKYLAHLYDSVEKEREEQSARVNETKQAAISKEYYDEMVYELRDQYGYDDAAFNAALDELNKKYRLEESDNKDKQAKQSYTIKSEVKGLPDWSTDTIKNKVAREAAEWLIKNHLENEKDVKQVFYDRETTWTWSNSNNAKANCEKAIIDLANEYKRKFDSQGNAVATYIIPSQVDGLPNYTTATIKNKNAREAAEWLIKNHLENEKDVKQVFYDYQIYSMVDFNDESQGVEAEKAIIRVSNEFKNKLGVNLEQQQASKSKNQGEGQGKPIEQPNKEYLSPREYYARKNAKRLEDLNKNIPQEMKDLKNWCAFKTYYDSSTGKKRKIILSPETGEWAKCNAPATWSTYEKAMLFAKERNCEGLSFALDPQNRIACVDLDHCISEGMRSELCWKILNAAPNTYAEKSVSGKGVHVFFKAENVTLGCNMKDDVKGIECYDRSKFISMTGNVISKTTALEDRPQKLIDLVRAELGPSQRSETSNNQIVRKSSGTPFMFESEVIEAIKKSAAGPDFERLYRGEDLCGDKSKSDAKLMSMLAFFTDCNPSQMKTIFESSGLYRESKGEKYVDRTIDFAIRTLKTRPSNLGKGNVKQQQKASGSQKVK